MNKGIHKSKRNIRIIIPPYCPLCVSAISENPYHIYITSIETLKEGWLAHGKGEFILDRFLKIIDVFGSIGSLPLLLLTRHQPYWIYCPKCGEFQAFYPKKNLVYKKNQIEIECDNCKGKTSFSGNIKIRCCSNCHFIYRAIMRTIPIQCAEFPCPKCGESQNLHPKIRNIKTDLQTFEFEVEIECKKCKKKKSLTNLIQRLFEIVKIEVKPTGISIKQS